MSSQEIKARLIIGLATANSVRGAARLASKALAAGIPQSMVQPIAREKKLNLKRANRVGRSINLPQLYDPNNGTGNPI